MTPILKKPVAVEADLATLDVGGDFASRVIA